MTTTVTVRTANWPVQVSATPCVDRQPTLGEPSVTTVEPYTERSFVVHDGQDLVIHELPEPAAKTGYEMPVEDMEAGRQPRC